MPHPRIFTVYALLIAALIFSTAAIVTIFEIIFTNRHSPEAILVPVFGLIVTLFQLAIRLSKKP
jgi:hypothetical protein